MSEPRPADLNAAALRDSITAARRALAEAEEQGAAAANSVEPGGRSYAVEAGYLRGALENLISEIEPYAAPERG